CHYVHQTSPVLYWVWKSAWNCQKVATRDLSTLQTRSSVGSRDSNFCRVGRYRLPRRRQSARLGRGGSGRGQECETEPRGHSRHAGLCLSAGEAIGAQPYSVTALWEQPD